MGRDVAREMNHKKREKGRPWQVKWTTGRCNRCGESKRIFATHGTLRATYQHLCGECYRDWKADSKNPTDAVPWGRDPTIDY